MTTTALKLIALALMFVDHLGEFIPGMPGFFRVLGRASAPLFIFCTVWGFHYTHNRKVYLTRMYLCSALMGLLDWALNASVAQPYELCYNNIFSTLLMICLFIHLWEMGDRLWKKALLVLGYLALNGAAIFLLGIITRFLSGRFGWDYLQCCNACMGFLPNAVTCEGSFYIVVMGIVLHFCKGSRKTLCLGYGLYCLAYLLMCLPPFFVGALDMPLWRYLFCEAIQWLQILSLPLMLLYNGQRGKGYKYLFYLFYPLHITILFYLGNFLA